MISAFLCKAFCKKDSREKRTVHTRHSKECNLERAGLVIYMKNPRKKSRRNSRRRRRSRETRKIMLGVV